MDTAARRARLRGRLAEAGVDALLVTKTVNVRYLTGFTGSAGRLLVTAAGDDRFVTDGRYELQAATEVADLPRTISRGDEWLPAAVASCRALGLESHAVSWDGARRLAGLLELDVRPVPRLVESLRAAKDPAETAALRRACRVGDAAFADLLGWIRAGLTETEVARRLERALAEKGAEERAFAPIVASGPNSARPHHRPGTRVLTAGDLVVVDFGARVDGYHSDMTRVVALGRPDDRLQALYDLVRAAQAAGLAAVRAGAVTGAVDAACRDVIAGAGHGDRFVHGTGHGIGLEVHEDPHLAAGAAATLPAGAVVTVEPGVYLPGTGGVRIEDTVSVNAAGAEVLTTTPKDLAVA